MYIKGGQIIDPVEEKIYRADLEIEDGRIRKILKEGGQAPKEAEVLEVSGLMIAPGLVDTHVHFRDPGFTYKEDILTGARAAAAGGFTQVVLMANTKPCVDSKETLSYVLARGKETGIRISSCATVTKGMQGKELVDMESLKEAAGFTDDGKPLLSEELVEEAQELVEEEKEN